MKVLFVCNQNQHRSPTAEALFKDQFETKSAGLYNGNIVTEELLEWADLVVVMEEVQREELAKRFPKEFMSKRVVNLDIPDIYSRDQPELKELLKSKMSLLEPAQ